MASRECHSMLDLGGVAACLQADGNGQAGREDCSPVVAL